MLKLGVFGKSRKDHEKRLPIHPAHLKQLDASLRSQLYFEVGYGISFGMADEDLAKLCGGTLVRKDLLNHCDIALMAKPIHSDFKELAVECIHWGWPHCVQQKNITQEAIDKRLTLIAWEAMHEWDDQGKWIRHTFNKNNEIAGYAGIQHSFDLLGIDGHFGPQRRAVVIGYGSVSQGAILGLQSRGVQTIEVLVPPDYIPGNIEASNLTYRKFKHQAETNQTIIEIGGEEFPIIDFLSEADVIVNGILQDTDRPYMFVKEADITKLKTHSLIVDISCDEGMGFSFAKPTSFDQPILHVGNIYYYAVDHTPSYLWNAASWEISKSLLPYLSIVMAGPQAWSQDITIKRAIEIQNGEIQNPKILTFQNRLPEYPYMYINR